MISPIKLKTLFAYRICLTPLASLDKFAILRGTQGAPRQAAFGHLPGAFEMEKTFRFDQAALNEVEAARTLAFVKYLPANCRHCAAFDESPLWSVITAKTGVTLWSARCTEPGVQAVCKDRGLAFEEAEGAEEQRPVFEVWTGAAWLRYRDPSDPEGLLRYLQEEGYAREDDPRHLTSSIDWSNPLTVAYAKHAARSPQNDWASLGAPWPLWAPCDAPATYARLCEPRLPACVTLVDDTETSRGLGSALFRYAAPAAEAFAQGCAVSFVGDGDGGGGSGGGDDDNNHVRHHFSPSRMHSVS